MDASERKPKAAPTTALEAVEVEAGGAPEPDAGGASRAVGRLALVAAAAFVLLAVVLAVVSVPRRAAMVGRVLAVTAPGTVVAPDGALYRGEVLETAEGDGGVVFDLGRGTRVVLSGGGELRVAAADALELRRGSVWIETRAGAPALEVRTTAGPRRLPPAPAGAEVRADGGFAAVPRDERRPSPAPGWAATIAAEAPPMPTPAPARRARSVRPGA